MTPKVAALGEALSVPIIELQTQTLVVYGGKGMGKTNLGADVAEELAAAGLRFAWLDPVGVAWGLKHSSDGKTGGIEVLILGGIHGDIPITPAAGEIVADLVVDEGVSVVVDISRHSDGKMWSAGEKIRFVRDYCTRLFMRQGENRRPLMQIIDEAGRFVPQQMPKGALDIAECVGAIEQLVELGRNVGVGVMLITQRSARMNKSVSELAEMMISFRTVGPNSIDAIMDWFGDHVPKARQREHIERIRQLPRGTALIVSPGWLGIEGEYEIRRRRTFDSSDTPRAGEERRVRGRGAQVDVDKYRDRMSEVETAAKENDPKELQKRIRELERELKRTTSEVLPAPDLVVERVEIPVVPDGLEEELSELTKQADRIGNDLALHRDAISAVYGRVKSYGREHAQGAAGTQRAARRAAELGPPPLRGDREVARVPRDAHGLSKDHEEDFRRSGSSVRERLDLPKGERLVLTAIAQHPNGCTREQITILTGYKRSTRDTYVQRLRERGLVGVDTGRVIATDDGFLALGDDYEPLPTGAALREYWLNRLPAGEASVLRVLIAAHSDGVSREDLTGHTGYKRSTRDTYIQRLRTRELVDVDGGLIYASDVLFEEA